MSRDASMSDQKKETSEYLLQFINDCYRENSISHMIATAYRYFGNPCALYDSSYKVLAWYGMAGEGDRIFAETMKNGYLSTRVLDYFSDSGLLSADYKPQYSAFEPTIHLGDSFTSKRLGIAIPSGDKAISGWFAVFETHRKINETDIYLTSWLAKILSPFLDQKNSNDGIPGVEDVLIDVLNGILEPDRAMERLALSGTRLPEKLRLLTIASENGRIPDPVQVILRSSFDPEDILWQYHNHTLILIDSGKADRATERIRSTIDRLGLAVSVSREFDSVRMLAHCYGQNLECIRIGLHSGSTERIYRFEDHTSELFLASACRHVNSSEYENPLLKKIREYDRENRTDYYESIRMYILYGNNMKRAAAELKIHRNTLNYRIQTISRLFGVDLYSQDVIMRLHLALAIEECRI